MSDNTNSQTNENLEQDNRLFQLVRSIVINPAAAKKTVENYRKRIKATHPDANESEITLRVADKIIQHYAKLTSLVGGATGLTGIVPGLGSAIAVTGGASTDATVCMKLQVDMCYCLAEAFGYDISTDDAQHLSLLIAAGCTLEKAGAESGAKLASKAGVKLLHQYLKGAVLQTIKELFKKIGITFTRKALEKALPFGVGAAVGGSANYALTKYVGTQAKQVFILDANMESSQE